MMKKQVFILTLIMGLFSSLSLAEVLMVDKIQQSQSFKVPTKGMTMNKVTSEFGEPEAKRDSVGEPPITVWKYNKFSVYFEHSWVINSVVHK